MKNRVLVAALLAVACASADLSGNYESTLPAASGGAERHVRVTLSPDGRAAVTSAFSGRPSRFFAEGTWRHEEGRVVVLIGERRERLVFQQSGDRLIAREWDRVIWGEAGPGVLYRVR